jgi:glycosyltransferase involved in cell wall biosynthesis
LDRRVAADQRRLGGLLEFTMISVAIATFNRAGMVRQAIEAALAQTRPPDEVVVADDASTDHTWAVLTELAVAEPRLRVFRRERNSGGVDNWNFAIEQTRGDYIAWCSDDDRFLPGHIEDSVAYLEAHPDTGLVHSGFVDAVEAAGHVETTPRPPRFLAGRSLDRAGLLPYMTRYYDWPFHPSTIVMRRSAWERVGAFDPAYALADTDWFVRAVERFPVAMLARCGVINRRHSGNWSNRLGSARMQREIFAIVEGAIERQWPEGGPGRWASRAIWRANARLRLALTLRMRIKSGHVDAAADLWRQLATGTGRSAPEVVKRAGLGLVRRWCAGREAAFRDARQSVSPL